MSGGLNSFRDILLMLNKIDYTETHRQTRRSASLAVVLWLAADKCTVFVS